MPDQPQQPTILVKKADGTSVRMTMDEFKEYRANTGASVSAPAIGAAPDKQPSEKKQNPVQWSDDDHASPLDASLHEDAEKRMMPPSKGIDERVLSIMSSLPFQVPGHLRGRLQSLLQSRLKDIRSDVQVGEYLLRPEASGGLGMDEDQMDAVMTAIAMVVPKKQIVPKNPVVAVSSKTVAAPVPPMVKPVAPKPVTPLAPVGTMPAIMAKPVMHDVIAKGVEKESVGPLDELKTMSLDEFRRLGSTTDERTTKLMQKFGTLQQESFLLYLEAVEAWKSCPLYRLYQETIMQSLQNHEPIDTRNVQAGMAGQEIKAIIEVNQHLIA